VFGGVLVGLILLFLVKDMGIGAGLLAPDGYAHVPDRPGRFGVAAEHYESQRRPGEAYEGIPSIQADFVRDPYVRLFVPYYPLRHAQVIAERCPGVKPFEDDAAPPDSAMEAVLRCWSGLQPVTLNGRPLAPRYRFYTHPRTRVRGMIAYIPTAGLPRGENVLEVERAPVPRRLQRPNTPKRPPYHIPFWL
jgi:hypothetical protein